MLKCEINCQFEFRQKRDFIQNKWVKTALKANWCVAFEVLGSNRSKKKLWARYFIPFFSSSSYLLLNRFSLAIETIRNLKSNPLFSNVIETIFYNYRSIASKIMLIRTFPKYSLLSGKCVKSYLFKFDLTFICEMGIFQSHP